MSMKAEAYWYLAWGRLALNPSITKRNLGKRPRREWNKVEQYAEKRKGIAERRLFHP